MVLNIYKDIFTRELILDKQFKIQIVGYTDIGSLSDPHFELLQTSYLQYIS